MPELPEVEILSRHLAKEILGLKFEKIIINNRRLRKLVDLKLEDKLKNKQIIDIYRRAKYIVIKLCDNQSLVIHLGMSGNLLSEKIYDKHNHIIFFLSRNKKVIYNDPRRFGSVQLVEDLNNFFRNTGPEPLNDNWTFNELKLQLEKKNIVIKQALMNGALIAGIGNIYACEILFISKISPLKKTIELTLKEYKKLHLNIRLILNKGIENGGSSIKNYKNFSGKSGTFQNQFMVYNNKGKCIKCHYQIKKIKQNNRSTFYCEQCQI